MQVGSNYHPEGNYASSHADYPRESIDSIMDYRNGYENNVEMNPIVAAEVIRFYPNGSVTWDGKGYSEIAFTKQDTLTNAKIPLTRKEVEEIFNVDSSDMVIEALLAYDAEAKRTRHIVASQYRTSFAGVIVFLTRFERTIKVILYSQRSFYRKIQCTSIRRKTNEELIRLY